MIAAKETLGGGRRERKREEKPNETGARDEKEIGLEDREGGGGREEEGGGQETCCTQCLSNRRGKQASGS